MSNKKETSKQKIAYFWAILTVVISIIVGVGVLSSSTQVLPLVLAIVAVLFGPVCGILYIMEIRKGVLSVDASEEE